MVHHTFFFPSDYVRFANTISREFRRKHNPKHPLKVLHFVCLRLNYAITKSTTLPNHVQSTFIEHPPLQCSKPQNTLKSKQQTRNKTKKQLMKDHNLKIHTRS